MDSAEETELRRALSQQGVLLGRQQEELTQPAGGTAGPAAGQPVHRSGFHISPGSQRRGSSPRGTVA